MRCVGADDPPCLRCVKAKRECIFSQSDGVCSASTHAGNSTNNSRPGSHSETVPSYDSTAVNRRSIVPNNVLNTAQSHPASQTASMDQSRWYSDADSREISQLPSIYSASPITTVESQASPRSTSTRSDKNANFNNSSITRGVPEDREIGSTSHVSDKELSHMIQL